MPVSRDAEGPAPRDAALRLLECWLPLAQALREAEGWDDTPEALAALVLDAAPLLRDAPSADAARAILAVYHTARRRDR